MQVKTWKEGYVEFTAGNDMFNQEYLALKEKVRKAKQNKKKCLQYSTAGGEQTA